MRIRKSTASLTLVTSILTDFLANRLSKAPTLIRNNISKRADAMKLYITLCDTSIDLIDVATMLINAKENGICAEVIRDNSQAIVCEKTNSDGLVDKENTLTDTSFFSFTFPYSRIGLEEKEVIISKKGHALHENSMPFLYGFLEVSLKDTGILLDKLKKIPPAGYMDFLSCGDKLTSILSECLYMIRFAEWVYKVKETDAVIRMHVNGEEVFVVGSETEQSDRRIELTPEYLLYLRMVNGNKQVDLNEILSFRLASDERFDDV